MKQKGIALIVFSLFFTVGALAQSVIDAKGTKITVDPTKWNATGTDIYNKNTGGVGIGTAGAVNPNAALEVKSTSKGILISRVALTSTTAFAPLTAHVAGMMVYNTATAGTAPNNVTPGFYYNDGAKWVKVADASNGDLTNDAWINDNANTQLKLGTLSDGSTVRPVGTEMVVKDDGKVGIGTENPAWLLDVQGVSAIGQFKRMFSGGATGGPGFLFTRTRGTLAAQTDIAASDYLGKIQFRGRVGGVDSDYATLAYIASSTTLGDGRFSFLKGTATSELMSINTNTGNVGIATSTPQKSLHVNGAAQITGELNVGGNATTAGSAGTSGQVLVSAGSGVAPAWSNVTSVADATNDAWTNDNANTQVKLGTQSNGTTARTAGTEMVIKDDGKTGIGTATPQKQLHVNGALQVTNELNVGGNATTAGSAGTSGQVLVSAGAGLAPAWSSVTNVADASNDAWINDNANTQVKLGTQSDGTTARTAGTEMVVKDDGKTGVGTATPQKQLHVNGALQVTNELNVGGNSTTAGSAGTAGQVLVSAGANLAPAWSNVSSVADATNDAWVNDNANALVKLGTQSDGTTARAAGTEMVVKDNGRVGIGTATPQATLHVKNGDFRLENEGLGNFNAYKGVTYSNSSYPQLFLFQARGTKAAPTYPQSGTTMGVFRVANAIDSAGGAGFRIRSTEQQTATAHGSSTIIYTTPNGQNGNIDQFIVDQNGYTGIGTMNPANRLSVEESGTGTYLNVASFLAPANTTANNNISLKFGVSSTNKNSGEIRFNYAADQSNSNRIDFSFNSIAAPLVSITAGGNLGIGTSTPQKSLHVAGAAQITGELNVGGTTTTAGSAGTSGQVLISNGAGAAPSWKATGSVSGLVAGAYYVQGTSAAATTNTTTAIDVPGVTQTIVVPTGQTQTVILSITGYAIGSGGVTTGQGSFLLLQNGTAISSAYASTVSSGTLGNLPSGTTLIKSVTLTAGSYIFKVQYKAWSGATQTVNNNPASSTSGVNVNYSGATASDSESMLTRMQILVYNN